MVYYLQQNVAILSQISKQISSVVPQVAIPSTLPPPFPDFNPSPSDVRVNAFWFMALIFSLFTALLATLVQQWVRDYMHVFQRYSDPLKSARIRQYLHEGCERWYMPVVAEAVPSLLHVSLFLFFAGLVDFILHINTTVGVSTTVPIGICGILYTFTTFAPVIYPQSPYQNPFSGLIWYLVQTLRGRRYMDRDGKSRSISSSMAQGQMQLAMEETEERKGRDARAIRWLSDNLTEDSELESFTMSIPGSFNGKWSSEVWTRMSEYTQDEGRSANRNEDPNCPPSVTNLTILNAGLPRVPQLFRFVSNPFSSMVCLIRTCTTSHHHADTIPLLPVLNSPAIQLSVVTRRTNEGDVVRDLSRRIGHLFGTCKNRGSFASDELWRRRTRACVEAAASLVFFADAELGWFGDIGRLLRDIGRTEKTRESSITGADQSFVTRWTCLSITTVRSVLKCDPSMQQAARDATSELESTRHGGPLVDGQPRTRAVLMDKALTQQWFDLWIICESFFAKRNKNFSRELAQEILQHNQPLMEHLQNHYLWTPNLKVYDNYITTPQSSIQVATHGLICELPGVKFDADLPDPLPFRQATEVLNNVALPFVPPGVCTVGLSSIFPRLQKILEGWDPEPEKLQELLDDLRSFQLEKAPLWGNDFVQLQLWRLQDLFCAGGLGFTVEIFLIALKQLLSTSPSKDAQSSLYVSTFKAITSDWEEHKDSLGTQKIILQLIASPRGLMATFNYPAYITEELLEFAGNMLKGQTGPDIDPHIDAAVEKLRPQSPLAQFYHGPPDFPARVLELLSSLRPPAQAS